MIAGAPSSINIQRHPTELIRYPDSIDIQSMVTGFPRIKNVLALERSFFVNHRLNNTSMEGITALSVTPSIKRITINALTSLIRPVAIANAPHEINDQKISFFALLLEA